MIVRVVICLLVFATATQAQQLAERFAVKGVAADDMLNVRAGPSASSVVIGSLPPLTPNVEVMGTQSNWAKIPFGETNGWVSMRYLAPNPAPANEIPRPLQCAGTEPFWDIRFGPRGEEYNELASSERRDLTVVRELVAETGYFIEIKDGLMVQRFLTITAAQCSDGMSDRRYSMSATLFIQTPNGNTVQSGCCTLQIN